MTPKPTRGWAIVLNDELWAVRLYKPSADEFQLPGHRVVPCVVVFPDVPTVKPRKKVKR